MESFSKLTIVEPRCRFCTGELAPFIDLGMSPPCESFLSKNELGACEQFYPLAALICHNCRLVQLPEHVAPDKIFTDYAYFSGFSDAWLKHAREYVDRVASRFKLNGSSQVIEIGSNDGYLLQYFVNRDIPALGIDPAANVAKSAAERGVKTLIRFFDEKVACDLVNDGLSADLIIGNNVMAQVTNLNSFVEGIRALLKPEGVCTIEFPHLLKTIEGNQFDQIYHEHFSYFTLETAKRIFAAHGLRIFDVEELWTHGGSLRIYACLTHGSSQTRPSVSALLDRELAAGLGEMRVYDEFAERVMATKRELLQFLIDAKNDGSHIAGYGAPGKGNTLLNYCGIRTDFVDYTVDRNPHKHGKYLPGTHIPIFPPGRLAETKPNHILILPWNLKDEIIEQLDYTRAWGARFVVPIPKLTVI